MRLKLGFILILISFTGCADGNSTKSYVDEIKQHQYEMNIKFSDKETSPLAEDDYNNFTALDFFKIDSSFRVKADFKRTPDEIPFDMPTTTERTSLEVKYGEASFTINGENYKLSLYQNPELILDPAYRNYLFLPFMDATNGGESYGGGRYLDLEIPKGNHIVLDFNKAYNPYCAYDTKFSCPIPPQENHLEIAITAGEKTFKLNAE